jgi:hypothetical protein
MIGAPSRTVPCTVHEFQPIQIAHQIDLGQRDQAGRDGEQIQDGEVFARLRHNTLVGGDDQDRRVDPPDTRQHILDKVTVAGHVDDPDALAVGQIQPCKADVDGHFAAPFFLQAIRVDPGQSQGERCLAVIDMSGGTYNMHQWLSLVV